MGYTPCTRFSIPTYRNTYNWFTLSVVPVFKHCLVSIWKSITLKFFKAWRFETRYFGPLRILNIRNNCTPWCQWYEAIAQTPSNCTRFDNTWSTIVRWRWCFAHFPFFPPRVNDLRCSPAPKLPQNWFIETHQMNMHIFSDFPACHRPHHHYWPWRHQSIQLIGKREKAITYGDDDDDDGADCLRNQKNCQNSMRESFEKKNPIRLGIKPCHTKLAVIFPSDACARFAGVSFLQLIAFTELHCEKFALLFHYKNGVNFLLWQFGWISWTVAFSNE